MGYTSLFLFGEVHAHDDDHHQKNHSDYAAKHKFISSDSAHHSFNQFSASAQIIPDATQFLAIRCQSCGVVAEITLDVVADLQGFVHHPHPLLQFIGRIREELALTDELRLCIIALLYRVGLT